jgi:LacI family transcriptional regulator
MKKRSVTIHDIARELNTTASTVSRALQDHPRISKSTKEAVWELARKLNYQPNSVASSLRKGKGNTIGVIVPRIDRNFFSSVISGIEDVAYEAGYNVLICQSYEKYDREKAIVEMLMNGKVDGILVSLASDTTDYAHFERVLSKGLPLIFFDRVADAPIFHKVEVDNYAGAMMAVEHLIMQGCKRIVHFAGPQHLVNYQKRLEGYKAALLKHHMEFDPALVLDDVITRQTGEQAAITITQMNPLPDGIFSSGDFSALGAILKLIQMGYRIPQDFAIVGFANEPYDDMLQPGLSSIDQHSTEMGQSVARMFLEQMKELPGSSSPKKIILTPDLLVRGSSIKIESGF